MGNDITKIPTNPVADPVSEARAARIAAIDAEEERLGVIVRRKAKIARDLEFFHRTPKWMISSPKELEERHREKILFESDLFRCIEEGCSFGQLHNPRSLRGLEAKQLREEKLAAEAQVHTQAAGADKETRRKAKRAASQKASRQRKAAAKKAAKELPPVAE